MCRLRRSAGPAERGVAPNSATLSGGIVEGINGVHTGREGLGAVRLAHASRTPAPQTGRAARYLVTDGRARPPVRG